MGSHRDSPDRTVRAYPPRQRPTTLLGQAKPAPEARPFTEATVTLTRRHWKPTGSPMRGSITRL